MKKRPVRRNHFYEGLFPSFDETGARYGAGAIRIRRRKARIIRYIRRAGGSHACASWRRPFTRAPMDAAQRKKLRQHMG